MSDFLEEKTKVRPINKALIVRRVIEVALLAVIFGLIACFTMVLLSPILEEKLFPAPANEVKLGEEFRTYPTEEIQPEDMLLEEQYALSGSEELDSKEQLLDMAYILRKTAVNSQKWLVQATGVSSTTSWLDSTGTSSKLVNGAIIADNGTELLILAEKKYLQVADRIEIGFWDGSTVQGTIKGMDAYFGYMVVAVDKNVLSEEVAEEYQVAELASSYNKALKGSIVLALGNTNGVADSVNYGFVTAAGVEVNSWDINYRLIKTDIYGTASPNGFLVNLQGQIIGVLCNDYNSIDTKNLLTAIGISDLKKKIEHMSNEDRVPLLGMKGVDVPNKAHTEYNIPYGAYITGVKLNSPAMKAGLQAGDVIVALEEKEITSMYAFSFYLQQLKAGNQVSIKVMRPSQGSYKESILKVTLASE